MILLLYPKMHIFPHMCEHARTIPKDVWNYPGEDEIKVGDVLASGDKTNQADLATDLIERHLLICSWSHCCVEVVSKVVASFGNVAIAIASSDRNVLCLRYWPGSRFGS